MLASLLGNAGLELVVVKVREGMGGRCRLGSFWSSDVHRQGKAGPGRRLSLLSISIIKEKNVLASCWCQYTEAGAGRRRNYDWVRLTLWMTVIVR